MEDKTIIALDVGTKRIGVARANSIALIAEPLLTLDNDKDLFKNISTIIKEQNAKLLVIGMPNNLEGNQTQQTKYTAEFVKDLSKTISIPVAVQNEALSSVIARDRLSIRKTNYDKSEVDSMAASVILESFIESNVGKIKQLV